MKLNVQWLKDYIDANDDIEKLADELTMSGSEVEEIEKPFEKLQGVVCARVVDVKKHPNADKLNICVVNAGDKEYTTVTSDLTVKPGDAVAFGPAGKASTADGKKVNSSELRGVKTDGMMFSLEEMGIESHSDHVFRFEEEVKIGADVKEVLGLDLTTFELEITPNRPDCLSHIGLAREVAVVEKKTLKMPEPSFDFSTKKDKDVDVEIESDGCWRYMAVRIDDVTVESSPLWLKKRLASVGLRSINNIADITNYVMMELGHPVHAFDYDKIPSSKLVIRDAKKGEKLLALNSKEYEFEGGEILITDGENPLAIAGVIGGEESGVSTSTTRVLLEIATFDPVRVRKASKHLNISTDASFRFERGVDANDTELVAKRLVELITSIARGHVVGFKDLYPHKMEEKEVYLSKRKLDSYVAYSTNFEDVEDCFKRLGFETDREGNGWNVTIPTFRIDISQDVDLIEEFARIYGLDNLPQTRSLPFIFSKKNEWWNFKSRAKSVATGLGYFEAITYPFVDPKIVEKFYTNEELESPKIINALSPEMSLMRPSLVFGLLNVCAYNLKHQQRSVRLFEIGRIFGKDEEKEMIAFISSGRLNEDDYTDKRNSEILNLKGDLQAFLDVFHVDASFVQKNIMGFENGRSAEILLNGKSIGRIGEISKEVSRYLDVKSPIHYAEIDLESIFENKQPIKYKKYSQYPSSFKDLSMFVEKGKVKAQEILKIAKSSSQYVTDVRVSDLYRGKNIPKTVYSLTITITYGAMDRTLSDTEINEAFNSLIEKLDGMDGITVRKV
ncbi:phenylalanine--tRNA ligase subunit beta [Mesoaciditoga lauensis]|uniref:phenylalanine--tRNA ligase subunit beta n=1 Tax=Mesoaciditoga lauensis TaxID=1495039 RepID=UPI0005677961|nr:phenylalanine--tRNA ligase subunit beta [Mesoaciditoga lauensis]